MTERERELYEGMSGNWRRVIDMCSPALRTKAFEAYEREVLHAKPYRPRPPADDWMTRPRRETVDPTPTPKEPEQQTFADRRFPDP